MITHTFLFTPGSWRGRGQITFSMAEDVLDFQMQWNILPKENEIIRFTQVVEVDNLQDPMHNHFFISEITPTSFVIELENKLVGKVKGKGVLDEKKIAWEFRHQVEGFDGYEIYELQKNGSYKMRAEFMGGDSFRTHISGTLEHV